MSTIKHATESAQDQPSIGRIAPLNMVSETNRLNHDSVMLDMATANDSDSTVNTSVCEHVSWA